MLRLERGDTVQLQVQYVCSIAIVRAIQWPRRDFKVTNHTHPLPTLTLTIHSSWTAAFQSLCPPSPSGLEFAYFSTKHCILLNLFLVSLPPSFLPFFFETEPHYTAMTVLEIAIDHCLSTTDKRTVPPHLR